MEQESAATLGLGSDPGVPIRRSQGAYFALTYEACLQMLTDPRMKSTVGPSIPHSVHLLFSDGEVHRRLRRITNAALPRGDRLIPTITEVVDLVVENLTLTSGEDLVSQFARPIAQRIAMSVLGLPAACSGVITDSLPMLASMFDPMATAPSLASARRASLRILRDLHNRLSETCSELTAGGFLSNARTREDISVGELCGLGMVLAHAAFENTENMLSRGAVFLAAILT